MQDKEQRIKTSAGKAAVFPEETAGTNPASGRKTEGGAHRSFRALKTVLQCACPYSWRHIPVLPWRHYVHWSSNLTCLSTRTRSSRRPPAANRRHRALHVRRRLPRHAVSSRNAVALERIALPSQARSRLQCLWRFHHQRRVGDELEEPGLRRQRFRPELRPAGHAAHPTHGLAVD